MQKVSTEKFFELVKIVESPKQLQKYNISSKILRQLKKLQATDSPYGWEACGDTLNCLMKVVKDNPSLHIFTQVDGEVSNAVFYENEIRIVNRNLYYLGTQNKDLKIYCEA